MNVSKKNLFRCLLFFVAGLATAASILHFTNSPLRALFPIEHYDQHLEDWIPPLSLNQNQALLSPVQKHLHFLIWYRHVFGATSPWNAKNLRAHLPAILEQAESFQHHLIKQYSQPGLGYDLNFRPFSPSWMLTVQQNIDWSSFKKTTYEPQHRGILIQNALGRSLPSNEPYFYNNKEAGEGYPFDYLQEGAVFAGTPVYILATTKDHAWYLVLTPAFLTWVKADQVATAKPSFIKAWLKQAEQQLVAITQTGIALIDQQDHHYRFSGFVGLVLPGKQVFHRLRVWIPVADSHQQAHIQYALLSTKAATPMPLNITPQHLSNLMTALLGRSYGWGGLNFHNDCASELRNLFTTFGIWLPAHSSDQADSRFYPVKIDDLSAFLPHQRIRFLVQKGHPWMTIVYIDNHVFLYLGSYINPNQPQAGKVPLSYQNAWALHRNHQNFRSIIGESVLLPILSHYPEDNSLLSQASRSQFKMVYLDRFTTITSKY